MNLRDWRMKAGLTSKILGDRCGVSEAAIRHYETGARRPRLEIAQRIEAATNGEVPAAELLGVSERRSRSKNEVAEQSASFVHDGTQPESDLLEEARSLGINAAEVGRNAVANAVKRARFDAWLDENSTALSAHSDDVRENGLWSDGLRLF